MKTKELIELLQKEDPEGECEAVVGGNPIHFVSREPGYWDGPHLKLIEDPSQKPYYAVKGMCVSTKEDRVSIVALSLEEALLNCDSVEEIGAFQLEFDMGYVFQESRKKYYLDIVEKAKLWQRAYDTWHKDELEHEAAKKAYKEFCGKDWE